MHYFNILTTVDSAAEQDELTQPVVNPECSLLPRGYEMFFMLNLTEHEISTAHKNLNADK